VLPQENPFADDDAEPSSSPFGDAGHVTCCRCGGALPREQAAYKVKTVGQNWWTLLIWGPLLGSIMSDERQERGYYCPLCLRLYLAQERRRRQITTAALIIVLILILVLFLLK
jgi:hypothetical protein